MSANVPRTRTKLILNTKRAQKKKTEEAEKAATAKAMQKGEPEAIKVKPPGENSQKHFQPKFNQKGGDPKEKRALNASPEF